MSQNGIFNATVCIIGCLILTIHAISISIKKNKRKDEKTLLTFVLFTILHFATYLTFTVVKARHTSDAFILAFYTAFYIMNNAEMFFLFRYAQSYMEIERNRAKTLSVINFLIFALFVALDIFNVFTGIFFTASGGEYLRSKTMIFSQGYQFIMFAVIFLIAATNKKLTLGEKAVFSFYCFVPLTAVILQNFFKGYAIAYLAIIIAIEILFLFLSAQKDKILAMEEEKDKEAQIKIMLSQIQPHFIYNSLSSISTLISIDPQKAQAALDNFTEYLRHNIASLTETRLIPFEDELKHIKSYVALEQMRFGDRVRVVYDIQARDFYVPPLSIQPLVENAIKHGILKKLEGGTLVVKTAETMDFSVVEVIDDGVGFRMEDVNSAENRHFGLNNIKYRVEKTCGGKVTVSSKTDEGTHITVLFYKEGRV